jgi:hypothetical protein
MSGDDRARDWLHRLTAAGYEFGCVRAIAAEIEESSSGLLSVIAARCRISCRNVLKAQPDMDDFEKAREAIAALLDAPEDLSKP